MASVTSSYGLDRELRQIQALIDDLQMNPVISEEEKQMVEDMWSVMEDRVLLMNANIEEYQMMIQTKA